MKCSHVSLTTSVVCKSAILLSDKSKSIPNSLIFYLFPYNSIVIIIPVPFLILLNDWQDPKERQKKFKQLGFYKDTLYYFPHLKLQKKKNNIHILIQGRSLFPVLVFFIKKPVIANRKDINRLDFIRIRWTIFPFGSYIRRKTTYIF